MKLLLSVQDLNKKLDEYRRAFKEITNRIKSANGLHRSERELKKAHAVQLECRVSLIRHGKEIEELKKERVSLRERIYGGTISNVRELNAVENEHNHVRTRLRKLEHSLDESKKKLEETTTRYEDLDKEFSTKKSQWEEIKKELLAERDKIGKEYHKLKSQHDERISVVPDSLLKVYKSLLKSTGDTPIACVVEGVCQGCFIKLPLTDFEKPQNSSKLYSCSTCNRILFFD